MMFVGFHFARNLTVCAIASLAIAACSSSDKSMPMAGNGETPMPMPLEIPATMVLSPDGVANAAYVRNYAEGRMNLSGDGIHVRSVTETDDGGATVVFMVDGQPHSVDFTAEQIANDDTVTTGGLSSTYSEIAPYDANDEPFAAAYYDLGEWYLWPDVPGDDYDEEDAGYIAFGTETMPANLPMGTVSYTGTIRGQLWDGGLGTLAARVAKRTIWGILTLNADLDNHTISGMVDTIYVRASREDGEAWGAWPATTGMEIAEGRIVDGRFAAGWTGTETAADARDEESLRGFGGDMLGAFYGPAGEEVAGVINGQRAATDTTPDQFIVGYFGGEQESPMP